MALGDPRQYQQHLYDQLANQTQANYSQWLTGITGTSTTNTITTNGTASSGTIWIGGGAQSAPPPTLEAILLSRPNQFTYKDVEFRRERNHELGTTYWEARYVNRHHGEIYTVCQRITDEEMELAHRGNEQVIELALRSLHRKMAEEMEARRPPLARASQRHRKNPFDVRWLDGPGSLLDKLQKETEHWLEPARTMMENPAHA